MLLYKFFFFIFSKASATHVSMLYFPRAVYELALNIRIYVYILVYIQYNFSKENTLLFPKRLQIRNARLDFHLVRLHAG
jgi:hypothetical protein